ncbi:permease-like cell division protein FtsX [Petroclostridium sp. X23]|uniref:cell division protein FtsX n=1 Tax=Petroclostridium sp. X23 TaxID=3045146 RepID=UPI0024AE360E|nr:permease-like cell division protein FtsX [Petroclostridium sp. X23]WHH57871.1 permease-like cell division protein FtsX [Petroclostridium sp. X23]
MKDSFYNIGYFTNEAKTIIRMNLLSNIFSLLSTGFIFFMLAMIMSGWWISSRVIEVIQGQTQISVYFDENMDNTDVAQLTGKIKNVEGIQEVQRVDANEAYARMAEILGEEARVLEFFNDNPFSPFIELKVHLQDIDAVIDDLESISGITYIRDNREVLNRLQDISDTLRFLGAFFAAAVGISTIVIISHIIRLGVHNNKEQINTLVLLGAPDTFIACPFLIVGLLLTLGGGLMAAALATFVLRYVYMQISGPLPFIPMPPLAQLLSGMVVLVTSLSAILGVIGSLFGLSAAKSS